jgi:transposase InsO family protein
VSLAALIAAQRVEHGIPVVVSCRALGVSQAWFHKWRNGDRSPRRKRRAALAAMIGYLFARHDGTYGSPRITADLRALGWRVSVNTVAKLMAEQGLVARRKRRRRGTTKARRAVAAFIDEYNTDRRHSTNGMLSPVDYERACAAGRQTAAPPTTAPDRRVA